MSDNIPEGLQQLRRIFGAEVQQNRHHYEFVAGTISRNVTGEEDIDDVMDSLHQKDRLTQPLRNFVVMLREHNVNTWSDFKSAEREEDGERIVTFNFPISVAERSDVIAALKAITEMEIKQLGLVTNSPSVVTDRLKKEALYYFNMVSTSGVKWKIVGAGDDACITTLMPVNEPKSALRAIGFTLDISKNITLPSDGNGYPTLPLKVLVGTNLAKLAGGFDFSRHLQPIQRTSSR